jgi:pimeloyl-ACP methyl ester carboxylesterase
MYHSDGFTVRYWETGCGTPLLFLHGAALPSTTFREIVQFLARTHTVIVPDIPGFGGSDFPDYHWDFSIYASLLKVFVDSLGLQIRHVVGYSFGGGIALHLAPLLPKLESLVLLSPMIGAGPYRHAGVLLRVMGEAVIGLYESRRKGTTRIYVRVVRDYIMNFFYWTLFQRRLLRIIVRCFERTRGLRPVTCRTTVVTADSDRFFPFTARLLRPLFPHAEFHRVRGHHLWALLDPATVQVELSRALTGCGNRGK